MTNPLFLATAGILDLNGTLVVELVAFILMILFLARWVYPRVEAAGEARQREIAANLEAAREENAKAEQRMKEAEEQLERARRQASDVLSGANKSAEQLRLEMRQRAEEEAKRISESARKDIEAERQKAVDSVRGEVADLVVAATEKVVGESLDDTRHRRLIEQAIEQVGMPGENGAKRGS